MYKIVIFLKNKILYINVIKLYKITMCLTFKRLFQISITDRADHNYNKNAKYIDICSICIRTYCRDNSLLI